MQVTESIMAMPRVRMAYGLKEVNCPWVVIPGRVLVIVFVGLHMGKMK